jgi:hypothetical protein
MSVPSREQRLGESHHAPPVNGVRERAADEGHQEDGHELRDAEQSGRSVERQV